jgi:hypothetical protein
MTMMLDWREEYARRCTCCGRKLTHKEIVIERCRICFPGAKTLNPDAKTLNPKRSHLLRPAAGQFFDPEAYKDAQQQ